MKPSVSKIKKSLCNYIREIIVQYKVLDTERIHTSDPRTVAEFIHKKIGDDCRENFVILCVDNKNMVVSYSLVSVGTVTEAIVHPREVFIAAIMTKASSVIIAHNHPSGNCIPSVQDIETTKRLVDGGKIIGIPVLDHIIIGFGYKGDNSYYSMKENGYMGC